MSSTIAGLAQAGGLEAAFEALVLTLDRLAIDHHGETFLEGERGDIGLVRYERGHRSRVKNTISGARQFGAIRQPSGNRWQCKSAWWGWEDSKLQPDRYANPIIAAPPPISHNVF
jgi:hypothetical protein